MTDGPPAPVAMSRASAAALAESVRLDCGHEVAVVAQDGGIVVEVARYTAASKDTFTLRDESDWDWLRDRIVAQA